MRNDIFRLLAVILLIIPSVSVSAQDNGAYGAFSPYSIYGIGDIAKEGTAYNKSMGGIGIATRNKRFINTMNPASVTERDSLSFMADFGLSQKNTIYRQGDIRSANNTFNISDFVLSFPVYKSSAIMIGINPFSDIGYGFTSRVTDPEIIATTGNITYNSYGEGSVYQMFIAGGVTFWKRLSLGIQGIYYFGNLDKAYNIDYSKTSLRSVKSGYELQIRGLTGKFGIQYHQNLWNGVSMVVGATYRLRTNVKGMTIRYSNAIISEVTDSLEYTVSNNGIDNRLKIADEIGVGVAFKGGDRWSAEFNYLRQGWSGSQMDQIDGYRVIGDSKFSATASQSFRAGFEFVPNRNDIRYYMKRCSYRAGVYYDQMYYKLDGNNVNAMGITLGITLPVFRLYNGISLGVDLGQKGSLKGNMVRERYALFVIGFNIHDLWFQKTRYK